MFIATSELVENLRYTNGTDKFNTGGGRSGPGEWMGHPACR